MINMLTLPVISTGIMRKIPVRITILSTRSQLRQTFSAEVGWEDLRMTPMMNKHADMQGRSKNVIMKLAALALERCWRWSREERRKQDGMVSRSIGARKSSNTCESETLES